MNGGIDQQVQQRVDAYRSKPQELQQSYAKNQQLIDLLALQKIKSEKEAAARQMQMQTQQNPQTIAQQREAELMQMTKNEMAQQQGALQKQQAQEAAKRQQSMGIAGVPAPNMQKMAGGGVVGFAPGGAIDSDVMQPKYQDLTAKEVLALVTEKGVDPKDIARITGGKWVVEMENDRPVVKAGDPMAMGKSFSALRSLGRELGEGYDKFKQTNPLTMLGTTIGEGAGYLTQTAIPEFMEGFSPEQQRIEPANKPTAQIPAKPKETPYDTDSLALDGEQRGDKLPTAEWDKTAIGTGTGIASVAPKQRSLGDFGGALPTDVAALRTRMDEAYGTLPELTVPEVQLPDTESILSKYSDPMYERTMQQRGRTPEEIAAREKMIADKESLYAEINDPEQAKRDRLWSTLAGAAGTGNIGYTGRNMLASSQGARSAQQGKRLKGLEAIQSMKMEDQKFRDENRAAGATAGYNFANTGLGQESYAARETAGRQWDQSKSMYDTAVGQGKDIFDTLSANEKANLQGDIELAKLSATERSNLLKEADQRRYQYEAKLTSALKEMQGIEMDLLGPTHPAIQKEQAAAAKGIPSDDPIWAQIEREKQAALMGNYQYESLKAQADNLRKMLSIDLLSELSDKYSMTPAEQ